MRTERDKDRNKRKRKEIFESSRDNCGRKTKIDVKKRKRKHQRVIFIHYMMVVRRYSFETNKDYFLLYYTHI